MTQKYYELSIVVPAYNERESLPLLIEKYKEAKKDVGFQLVVVDNGSSDGSWEFLNQEIKKAGNEFIKLVKIEKNIGYGNGIHQGLKKCNAEVIGWSHADLQCSPDDIFKAYKIYSSQKNKKILVKGNRKGRDMKSLILTYGLAVYSIFILWKIFDDTNGQPKLFPKKLLLTFENPPKAFSYDLYAQYKALKNNHKVISFPVIFEKRHFGISKWAYSVFSKLKTIKGFLDDVMKIKIGTIR